MSDAWKNRSQDSKLKSVESFSPTAFAGKTHTEETKSRIGASNAKHQKGSGNSNYGNMWVTNGNESKLIKKNDAIPDGWKKGRKINRAL